MKSMIALLIVLLAITGSVEAACSSSTCVNTATQNCACKGWWAPSCQCTNKPVACTGVCNLACANGYICKIDTSTKCPSCVVAPKTTRTTFTDQISFAGDQPRYIAMMDQSFDETVPPPGGDTTIKTNYQTQLYITDRTKSTVRMAVGAPKALQGNNELYFYAKAGYIMNSQQLVTVVSGVQSIDRTWYITYLNNTAVKIFNNVQKASATTCNFGVLPFPNKPEGPDNERGQDDCNDVQVIPSPDGKDYIIYEHVVKVGDRTVYPVKIRLFKAANPLVAYFTRDFDFKSTVWTSTWQADGSFTITSDKLKQKITTAGVVTTLTATPACINPPKTSSSDTNLAREQITITDATATIKQLVFSSNADFPFGCGSVSATAAPFQDLKFTLPLGFIKEASEIDSVDIADVPIKSNDASYVASSSTVVVALATAAAVVAL